MHKIFFTFLLLFVCLVSFTTAHAAELVASTTALTPTQIEAKVRTYFADIPVMIAIAKCESEFRQFTDAGKVFYGGSSNQMIGVFQFYESIHKARALALGFDLATVDGNLGYARQLYLESGVKPWQSCVPATTPTLDANTELRIKLMLRLIDLLQQLLALKLANG